MKVVVITGAIICAKLQSNHHRHQTNTRLVTGRMSPCCPINRVKAFNGKSVTFHALAHPKLSWEFSNLVFDHSRLLVTLQKVAKPLVSFLTPITHCFTLVIIKNKH